MLASSGQIAKVCFLQVHLKKATKTRTMNFRGVSIDQDSRFSRKDTKLRNSIPCPSIFSQSVNLKHVNMNAMRPWIKSRLTELAGYEDDILTNYAIEMLETAIQSNESNGDVDPREMQVNLTALTDQEKAFQFMEELWTHLVSATNTPSGIPEEFLAREREKVMEARRQQEQIRSQIERRSTSSRKPVIHDNSSRGAANEDARYSQQRRRRDVVVKREEQEEAGEQVAATEPARIGQTTLMKDERNRQYRDGHDYRSNKRYRSESSGGGSNYQSRRSNERAVSDDSSDDDETKNNSDSDGYIRRRRDRKDENERRDRHATESSRSSTRYSHGDSSSRRDRSNRDRREDYEYRNQRYSSSDRERHRYDRRDDNRRGEYDSYDYRSRRGVDDRAEHARYRVPSQRETKPRKSPLDAPPSASPSSSTNTLSAAEIAEKLRASIKTEQAQ